MPAVMPQEEFFISYRQQKDQKQMHETTLFSIEYLETVETQDNYTTHIQHFCIKIHYKSECTTTAHNISLVDLMLHVFSIDNRALAHHAMWDSCEKTRFVHACFSGIVIMYCIMYMFF